MFKGPSFFEPSEESRSNQEWKFKIQLLTEDDYRNNLLNVLDNFLSRYDRKVMVRNADGRLQEQKAYTSQETKQNIKVDFLATVKLAIEAIRNRQEISELHSSVSSFKGFLISMRQQFIKKNSNQPKYQPKILSEKIAVSWGGLTLLEQALFLPENNGAKKGAHGDAFFPDLLSFAQNFEAVAVQMEADTRSASGKAEVPQAVPVSASAARGVTIAEVVSPHRESGPSSASLAEVKNRVKADEQFITRITAVSDNEDDDAFAITSTPAEEAADRADHLLFMPELRQVMGLGTWPPANTKNKKGEDPSQIISL